MPVVTGTLSTPVIEQLTKGNAWADEPDLRNLALWLRPGSPEELQRRIEIVDRDRQTYEALRDAQLRLVRNAIEEDRGFRAIEERLGLR